MAFETMFKSWSSVTLAAVLPNRWQGRGQEQRQATQHGCRWAIVYGEEKNILYWTDWSSQAQNKNHLYRHDKPNEPIKEGPLSFVFFESPCTSVSTISRRHPSLVSLDRIYDRPMCLAGNNKNNVGEGESVRRYIQLADKSFLLSSYLGPYPPSPPSRYLTKRQLLPIISLLVFLLYA
jgi:hypothetical protein